MTWLRSSENTLLLSVHVCPRSKRVGVLGEHAGRLKIGVSAPPAEGAANEALIQFLKELLRVPATAIRIVQGHSNRHKVVAIAGIPAATARSRLQPSN